MKQYKRNDVHAHKHHKETIIAPNWHLVWCYNSTLLLLITCFGNAGWSFGVYKIPNVKYDTRSVYNNKNASLIELGRFLNAIILLSLNISSVKPNKIMCFGQPHPTYRNRPTLDCFSTNI